MPNSYFNNGTDEKQSWHRDRLRRQELERRAKTEVCRECGGPLVVRYPSGEPVLACGTDPSHTGTKREVWKHAGHGAFRKEGETMESKALTQMPRAEMEQRVNSAKWPANLTVVEKQMLATVALEYGLDPLMGELSIFQGKPYICINGRRRKAQEHGDMDGMEDTRPATRDEREAWGIPDGDYLFRAAIYKKGCRMPFVGWGRVKHEEIDKLRASALGNKRDPEAIPAVKDPQAHAAKRAEGQALMKGWHIPLPSIEDIEGTVDVDYRVIEEPPAKPVPAAMYPKRPKPADPKPKEAAHESPKDAWPPKTTGELFTKCHSIWGMQPTDVLRELGISSKTDIIDMADAWHQIVALKETPELATDAEFTEVESQNEAPPLDGDELPF